MIKSAILVLEDGTQFHGRAIGAEGAAVGEVVFNTSMTGYQEILTDPSYSRQIVTLTYPHIGNVGVNSADKESLKVQAQGLVIRDLPLLTSNFRCEETLSDYLKRHNIVAIADIDTRKLTRLLREKGSQNGCIIAGKQIDAQVALEKAQAFPGLEGMDLAKEVTTKQIYPWLQGSWTLAEGLPEDKQEQDLPYHVVAYDFGAKRNILRMLVDRGCRLTVVPAQTPAEDVLKLNPDGIFLSNGPGDPAPCGYAIEAIKTLLETEIPIFGICLGHQLLALASGAETMKMKFGHHGANHPVRDLECNVVMITAQNHGFAVDERSLPSNLNITHKSLFDGTLQGIHRTDKPAFSFQGHPEASPGPHETASLFDHFIDLIEQYCQKNNRHNTK
ncbi:MULTISPECIES: glutamine-hydrolyzing carbamoyl-phosphate synthase small subunit [Photorhabdus]|uniref:Carbamoyl phosphate synthase small chain n=1 Tax=Photorhabdus hindustanensis TaxID=2918802 RepID=A0A0A0CN53_9GAMM|nr:MULTISPECIES: glutamine-hydrolyzing carbamoyl-phosphate synthase small subunit [Photorhabdus]KGM27190.1 carbamoyl phosphate synthase small subunit [Photorhabdus luminescens]MBS9429008.1 carbamoyl-phosphate synthase small subunit [Photorhabdus akhurstii]MCC8456723.1 glutamine-hydrolyzing carbamoyl-phosphate synthase small subunit [Photorhabdus aegyptia]PQQ27087.1 carbamoyl-phosphate synthase small subunit [Photorhabdus hindustanensis]PQQ42336.1 carbamoyl-phosphate synthase small subunit [Pho